MATIEPQLMNASPRGVPVEWPYSFDGNEPLQWIDKIERVFCRFETTDPYRLKIASIYFDGPVVPWFQELQQSGRVTSWESLKIAILAAVSEGAFRPQPHTAVVIDDTTKSKTKVEEALEFEDEPQLFDEMPAKDQGSASMLEGKALLNVLGCKSLQVDREEKLTMESPLQVANIALAVFDNMPQMVAEVVVTHPEIVIEDTMDLAKRFTKVLESEEVTAGKGDHISECWVLVIAEPEEPWMKVDMATVLGRAHFSGNHHSDTYGWFDMWLGSHRLIGVMDRRDAVYWNILFWEYAHAKLNVQLQSPTLTEDEDSMFKTHHVICLLSRKPTDLLSLSTSQATLNRNDGGNHFPLFAICVGFEPLNMFISQNGDISKRIGGKDQASTLHFSLSDTSGTLFHSFPQDLLTKLSPEYLDMQNHMYGISHKKLQENVAISSFFKILISIADVNHELYVSTAPAYNYPITAFSGILRQMPLHGDQKTFLILQRRFEVQEASEGKLKVFAGKVYDGGGFKDINNCFTEVFSELFLLCPGYSDVYYNTREFDGRKAQGGGFAHPVVRAIMMWGSGHLEGCYVMGESWAYVVLAIVKLLGQDMVSWITVVGVYARQGLTAECLELHRALMGMLTNLSRKETTSTAMTLFLRTEMHHLSVEAGVIFMGALSTGLLVHILNGFSDLAMSIAKLPVFYKQRDGQLDPIISAKTVSLTCTKLEFSSCSIAGVSYGRGSSMVELATLSRNFLILFTCTAIIGCIVLYKGEGKLHGCTLSTLDYVVGQANFVDVNLSNFWGILPQAKTIGVERILIPADIGTKIDSVGARLYTCASDLATRTTDNSEKIKEHKKIQEYPGHSVAVRCMIFSKDRKCIDSSGVDERDVALWRIYARNNQYATCVPSMEQPAVFLDSKVSHSIGAGLYVFSNYELSIYYIWKGSNLGDLRNSQPTRISFLIESAFPKNSKCVLYAARFHGIVEASNCPMLVACGSLVQPFFPKVLWQNGVDVHLHTSLDGILLLGALNTLITSRLFHRQVSVLSPATQSAYTFMMVSLECFTHMLTLRTRSILMEGVM